MRRAPCRLHWQTFYQCCINFRLACNCCLNIDAFVLENASNHTLCIPKLTGPDAFVQISVGFTGTNGRGYCEPLCTAGCSVRRAAPQSNHSARCAEFCRNSQWILAKVPFYLDHPDKRLCCNCMRNMKTWMHVRETCNHCLPGPCQGSGNHAAPGLHPSSQSPSDSSLCHVSPVSLLAFAPSFLIQLPLCPSRAANPQQGLQKFVFFVPHYPLQLTESFLVVTIIGFCIVPCQSQTQSVGRCQQTWISCRRL